MYILTPHNLGLSYPQIYIHLNKLAFFLIIELAQSNISSPPKSHGFVSLPLQSSPYNRANRKNLVSIPKPNKYNGDIKYIIKTLQRVELKTKSHPIHITDKRSYDFHILTRSRLASLDKYDSEKDI